MKTIHEKLSKNIKYFLKKNKMTMEALSFEIDINKAHVSRIISCQRQASLDVVQKIADVFEVKVDRMFK
ncbi:helix-turn-helix transcriptional regulator [bacterium]|nr:helix-turn-helix transcriptional regulator [bacterium]